ncbi:TPA: hypothetical protein EYO57_11420 [Candidatus Poribacteria bacterium]|nr:hypothetical protein [Candidatus Poribacteria bacterium]
MRFTGTRKRGGIGFSGAGFRRRKRGGMAISGAGYKKRKKVRRKRGRRGGGLFNPTAVAMRSLIGLAHLKRGGGGQKILSGAVWHGYGSGVNLHGAGIRGKRVLARRGSGKRLI